MDNIKILPPFCRQGNKYSMLDIILPLIPNHLIYVELFLGSGAVFFNKPKAKINILNDLDKNIINNLKLLKKASKKSEDYNQNLNTIPKLKTFLSNHSLSIEDQLLYEKIKSCYGYNGMPVLKENNIYKNNNPFSIFKNIQVYQDKLKSTKLLSKDYEEIIDKFDSPKTFFFIDPPYENTRESFGYAEASHFDFERFAENIKKIQGYFLITINDSAYIRKLFKHYNIQKINIANKWLYGKINKNKKRKELIITNYII
jgi:DNA adenine methylase